MKQVKKEVTRLPSFGEDPDNLNEPLSPKQIKEMVHEETSNDACNSQLAELNNTNNEGNSDLDFSGLVRQQTRTQTRGQVNNTAGISGLVRPVLEKNTEPTVMTHTKNLHQMDSPQSDMNIMQHNLQAQNNSKTAIHQVEREGRRSVHINNRGSVETNTEQSKNDSPQSPGDETLQMRTLEENNDI